MLRPSRVLSGLTVLWVLSACEVGPSSQEPAAPTSKSREAILASVRRAVARPALEVREVQVGGVTYREAPVGEGYSHLVLGRVGKRGQVEALCVSDEETARRFLAGEVGAEQ